MIHDIIIIGAGGVGRETAQLIEDINCVRSQWNIVGFVDDNAYIQNCMINGYRVVGTIDWLNECKSKIYAVCAIGDAKTKKAIISRIVNKNVLYANLLHPSAIVSKYVEMGHGIIIQSNCVITTNVKLGNHIGVNPQCGIAHDTVIGDYSSLFWNVNVSGNVTIGEGCVIGTKTTIIQGKNVGEWTIIGSNSNVITDVPPRCTAVGNPAKPIKYHMEEKVQ